jgi:hypothetical protein
MFKTINTYLAIGVFVAVVAVGVSLRIAGDDTDPSRAAQAWTDRLTAQAAAIQDDARADRASDADTQRLVARANAYFEEAAAAEQANDAWSDRLNGLAADATGGMSPRVAAAWTARLNGLAGETASR